MPPTPSPHASRATSGQVGQLAESFVATWLVNRGWTVLHRRWRCQWGELDLVMERASTQGGSNPPILAFVEVKARRRGSWDEDGLLSITPQKQAKLWQAAQLFLMTFPHLAQHTCRFDVALVRCQPRPTTSTTESQPPTPPLVLPPTLQLGQSFQTGSYQLTLQQYIPGAFHQPDG